MSIKIALVGAGHMGRIHLEKLLAMDDVEVSGIVDVDAGRASELSRGGSIPCFTDYRDLLALSDGAVIATPTESHHEIGRAFLDSGSHLFIEKPVASNQEESRELIETANKKRLVFQVGHLERFNPAFLKAAQDIRKPLYIEARRVSPFTGRSTDVTVILDVMIHDIDLVLSLVKDGVKEVKAQGLPFLSEKLDMVSARIEFEKGCVANLFASRIATGRERSMAIYEQDRYFSIDLMAGKLTVAKRGRDGAMETVEHETPKGDAVKHELTEFIEAIRGITKPSVTGRDGLNALMLADLIDQYIAARPSV